MSEGAKYNVSIGDNNRDIVIGEGITLVKTGNIEVGPGGVLTINVNGRKQAWAGEIIAAVAARPGEILVLIAEFDGDGQSDWKIEERIRKAIQIELNRLESGSIRVVRLRNLVIEDGDEEKARSLAEAYGAAMLIWGWYDQVGFSPRFTVAPKTALENPTPDLAEILIDAADRAFRQYMFRDLPAEISYLATFTAAQILYWEHRFDEAQRTFDRVFAQAESGQISAPGLPLAYFYQGVLLGTRRGDIQGVVRCMKRATELDPTFAHAFYNWADALYADGQFEEAIDKLSSALKLAPKHLYALRERGDAYFRLGRFAEAIGDYTASLELYPSSQTYIARGRAYELTGQKERAIGDFVAANSLDPMSRPATARLEPYAKRGHGKSAYGTYEHRDAQRYYETAAQILGHRAPPLIRSKASQENQDVQTLAELLSLLIGMTGFHFEAIPSNDDLKLEAAGHRLIEEIIKPEPSPDELLSILKYLSFWPVPHEHSDSELIDRQSQRVIRLLKSVKNAVAPGARTSAVRTSDTKCLYVALKVLSFPGVRVKCGEKVQAAVERIAHRYRAKPDPSLAALQLGLAFIGAE